MDADKKISVGFTTIQNKLSGFVGNCFRKYYAFKFLREVFERKQSLSLLIM